MAFPQPDKWEPGIYFGLDEELYHSLPWCGSTDIKKLACIPQDYWAGSPMNPLRDGEEEEETTAAKTFGTAIHTAILHGDELYKRRYGTVLGDPGKEAVSAEGVKDWIKAQGAAPRKLKEENIQMIMEEWGYTLLTEKQNERILKAAQTMRSNPYLVQAFTGGFPEVSVFWVQDGVPCKARFDYLKLGATVDLKSFRARKRMMDIDRMVLNDIFQMGYFVQAAHYQDGRYFAKELFLEGRVFAADPDPDDPTTLAVPSVEWLGKCLGNPEPGWVFVFYKADGAPIAKSYQSTFNGSLIQAGQAWKRRALTNYQSMTERFGTDTWVNTDEPYNIDNEDVPKWT